LTNGNYVVSSAVWRNVRFGSAALVLGLVAVVLVMPLPNHYRSPWLQKLMDLGHVPLFALLMVCVWLLVRRRIWLAIGIVTAMAIAAEIGQGFAGRSQDPLDILRSLIGAAIGALALHLFRRPIRWRSITTGLVAVLALAAWPIWDSVPVLIDAVWAYRAFPVLSDFSSPWEARRWLLTGAVLERQPAADLGRPWIGQLHVDASGGAAILFPVVRDWSSYQRLSVTFSFAGDPLDILISVRDGRPVAPPRRRFDLEQRYTAGKHGVVIDLVELGAGTRFAPLDLSRVQSFHFVVTQSAGPRTLFVHSVTLE
jgi:hypothetical protein